MSRKEGVRATVVRKKIANDFHDEKIIHHFSFYYYYHISRIFHYLIFFSFQCASLRALVSYLIKVLNLILSPLLFLSLGFLLLPHNQMKEKRKREGRDRETQEKVQLPYKSKGKRKKDE